MKFAVVIVMDGIRAITNTSACKSQLKSQVVHVSLHVIDRCVSFRNQGGEFIFFPSRRGELDLERSDTMNE